MNHKSKHKLFSHKGQAAMEFLMTYGWAILIVLVAIAALYFMGVFSPPVSETCLPKSPFLSCGVKVTATNTVIVSATWPDAAVSGNPSITNFDFEGGGNDCVLAISLTTPGTPSAATPCVHGLAAGDSYKAKIVTTYTRAGISHTVNFDASGTVE